MKIRSIALLAFALLTSSAVESTTQVSVIAGSTIYLGSDGKRSVTTGRVLRVCKLHVFGRTAFAPWGHLADVQSWRDSEGGHNRYLFSFEEAADGILASNRSADSKYADLKRSAQQLLVKMVNHYDEAHFTDPKGTYNIGGVLASFEKGKPSVRSFQVDVVDWSARQTKTEERDELEPYRPFQFPWVHQAMADNFRLWGTGPDPKSDPVGFVSADLEFFGKRSDSIPWMGVGPPYAIVKLTRAGATFVRNDDGLCHLLQTGSN